MINIFRIHTVESLSKSYTPEELEAGAKRMEVCEEEIRKVIEALMELGLEIESSKAMAYDMGKVVLTNGVTVFLNQNAFGWKYNIYSSDKKPTDKRFQDTYILGDVAYWADEFGRSRVTESATMLTKNVTFKDYLSGALKGKFDKGKIVFDFEQFFNEFGLEVVDIQTWLNKDDGDGLHVSSHLKIVFRYEDKSFYLAITHAKETYGILYDVTGVSQQYFGQVKFEDLKLGYVYSLEDVLKLMKSSR